MAVKINIFVSLAIREDRTRGGRSTYQCSYTLPASLAPQSQVLSAPTNGHAQSTLRMEDEDEKFDTTLAIQSAQDEEMMEDSALALAQPSDLKPVPRLIQVCLLGDHIFLESCGTSSSRHELVL